MEFLEREAREESGAGQGPHLAEEPEEGGDEEEGDDDDDGFIVGEGEEEEEEQSSPSTHRRLDAALREQEAESVMPYFPLAFAVGEHRPLAFNFNLFLLDSLCLPRPISPRDSQESNPGQAVTFEDANAAIAYCTQRLESGWKATRPASSQEDSRASSARLSHPSIDKFELFRRDGKRLTKALESGKPALDENLHRVRLDRQVFNAQYCLSLPNRDWIMLFNDYLSTCRFFYAGFYCIPH